MTVAFMALVMGGVTDRNMFQVSWAAEVSSSEQKNKWKERWVETRGQKGRSDPWRSGLKLPAG